ncbi:MAG: hypothetical protein ACFFCW_41915 [Candidatus Hodarchaeota archaeon]
MAVQLLLRPDQLKGLSVIRDLGPECIQIIVDKISSCSPPPIKPSKLRQVFNSILKDDADKVDLVIEQLLSLYSLQRQRRLTPTETLEGINYGINSARDRWSDDDLSKWKEIESQFLNLLDVQNIWLCVKSLDLSYDYSKLLRSAKIITDIRPVYSEDASQIHGAVISYTLRLSYESREGNGTISIALDEDDVRNLLETSKRALKKAETAKKFMVEKGETTAFICGEEE